MGVTNIHNSLIIDMDHEQLANWKAPGVRNGLRGSAVVSFSPHSGDLYASLIMVGSRRSQLGQWILMIVSYVHT